MRKEMGDGKRDSSQLASSSHKDQTENSGLSMERAKSIPDRRMDLTNLSSSALRKKVLKSTKPVRRSARIHNTTSTIQDKDIEPVFEEIDASESEKEDQPCADLEKKDPEDVPSLRSLREKIDDLNLLLDEQGKTIEEMNSKRGDCCCSLSQAKCLPDIRLEVKKNKYKSMYIDSQKKIEALRDENYQLGKKLESAIGKLEVYGKGFIPYEAIEKLKETIIISSLSKTTETVLALRSSMKGVDGIGIPTATADNRPPEPKRKKLIGTPTVMADTRPPEPKRKEPSKGSRNEETKRKKLAKDSRKEAPKRKKLAKDCRKK